MISGCATKLFKKDCIHLVWRGLTVLHFCFWRGILSVLHSIIPYMRRTLGDKHLFLKRSVWREMFVLHHLGEELCVILTLFEEKCWCSTPVCATYLVWEGHVDRVLMLPAAPTGLHCLCYPGKEGAKWRMGGQPERRVQRLPASIYFGNKSLLLLLNH